MSDIGGLADFAENAIQPARVGDAEVVVIRRGEQVFAVGAKCPHAGAPLAEAVLDGDRLICPWHKASFCIRTGRMLDPPAVDPLPRYDTRIENGRVLLQPHDQAATPSLLPKTLAPDRRVFVIVGAGAAGSMAAQSLREAGFGGRILMLDRQNRVPYDRTILSKYALSGEHGAEKSPLQTQAFYRAHRIERLTEDIVRLDARAKRIACASGTVLPYDAALVATGADPRPLSLPGSDLANVFALRSRADADAILAQAERSRAAVILGSGFIGMEVAASLRERGLDVTIVAHEAAPFEKQLGAEIGRAFIALHEQHGVQFRLGHSVRVLEGARRVRSVILENGEEIAADLVVAGLGVRPETGFVEGVARAEDGGIDVDSRLCAAEGLFAAGDVARFPLRGDGERLRVEHWRVAQQHGRVAALNMAGQPACFDQVPVFWTIQYLKRLDYIGHCDAWDRIVLHGAPDKQDFLVYYVKNGTVAAAAGMGRDRDTAALIPLFEHRRDWTPEALGAQPAETLARLAR